LSTPATSTISIRRVLLLVIGSDVLESSTLLLNNSRVGFIFTLLSLQAGKVNALELLTSLVSLN